VVDEACLDALYLRCCSQHLPGVQSDKREHVRVDPVGQMVHCSPCEPRPGVGDRLRKARTDVAAELNPSQRIC